VHSSLDSLDEFVPRDMLPEEYGGKAGPIGDINRNFKKIIYYISVIEHENIFFVFFHNFRSMV